MLQESHDAKRMKLSENTEETTIASSIKNKTYTTIDEVVRDVNAATSGVVHELKEVISGGETTWVTLQEKRAEMARVAKVKKELDKLVRVEMFRRPDMLNLSKGFKDEHLEETDLKAKPDNTGDNVLTLLADTRPPKQLFSSLRKPEALPQPLSEVALPNGITTTKIIPKHSINEIEGKPVPTLKEVFPPPASLPTLPIPKQSKHTITKSSSVSWYNPTEIETKSRSGRRDTFFTQPLSTGQWLTYNVAPSPTQLASPETKRKQRDRALSIGEPQNSLSEETIATHNQAKEDALFRSVYSSFAPDRDDSGALVSEQQKNRLWWRKYGESRYLDILENRDGVREGSNGVLEEELNEDELREAIQDWKPEDDKEVMKTSKTPKLEAPENSQEADDLLRDISDLLETLDSHQRIRNLTGPMNGRTVSGAPQLSGMSGNQGTPSSAESDVYEMLKAQLVLIVSSLPPYLLAKLDGDKLGALNISTKIQIESKNQKGTMEDGEASATARARIAAPATQSPSAYPAAPARNSSYLQATATPTQQYPRVGYAPSTASRPPPASSYLQNPQYSNRPSNYPAGPSRSSYGPQTGYTPQPAPPSSASRYNYGQQYGQQSQSAYGAYQNGYRPYSGQNTGSYTYNSQYSTAQARPPPAASPQPYRGGQTDYQQRPVPPQGYGYGSTQGGGGASPQTQARSSYPPQGQGSSQRPPLYQQSSSGYQSQTSASPQINGTSAAAAGSDSAVQPRRLSAEEQSAVMEKQKAQLAEQHSRQGSGTPQPGNGQNGQQHEQQQGHQNGTAVQQNGVTA